MEVMYMLVALNQKNQHVYADKLKTERRTNTKKEEYICPCCQAPVFLKQGKLKQAHFAHYHQTTCQVFSEGETEEHLLGKKLLFEWFVKQGVPCQLEAYLPGLKQRPDLLVWLNSKTPIVIEFQCSSLSSDRMIERTEGYQNNQYEVYWILGSKFKFTQKLTSFQRLFMKKSKTYGYYLYSLDVYQQQLHLISNIHQKKVSQQVACEKTTFKSIGHFSDLFMKRAIETKMESPFYCRPQETLKKELLQSHLLLNRRRRYQEPEMVAFQKYIYRHGHSLVSLPMEVYLPVENKVAIKKMPHFWKYILLEWLVQKELKTILTKQEIDNQIKRMIDKQQLVFFTMPLVTLNEQIESLLPFIEFLTTQGILEKITKKEWRIKARPYYYLNEQEKIKDFSGTKTAMEN